MVDHAVVVGELHVPDVTGQLLDEPHRATRQQVRVAQVGAGRQGGGAGEAEDGEDLGGRAAQIADLGLGR